MSVLGHVLEERGIATVAVALVREHAARVRPPRALYVPFPFGYTLGKPDDPEYQTKVITAALDLLKCPAGPVLADFGEETWASQLVQASAVRPPAEKAGPEPPGSDPANEVTALRVFYERWVADHDGRTSVGVSGVPQRRFRGMIRFLESYARGGDADMKERPRDVSIPQFVRYCGDDLKAFFYEARMSQRPKASDLELHTWFWGQTATGQLLSAIAQGWDSTDDRELTYLANGLAR